MENEYAFPMKEPLSNDSLGMTLRDYFAAKALQGLLASDVRDPAHKFAAYAYKVADAMLEARNAKA